MGQIQRSRADPLLRGVILTGKRVERIVPVAYGNTCYAWDRLRCFGKVGYDMRDPSKASGSKDVSTAMIYTHVSKGPDISVQNPLLCQLSRKKAMQMKLVKRTCSCSL